MHHLFIRNASLFILLLWSIAAVITIQAETEVLDGLYLELKNAKTESDAQLIEQKICEQ